MRGHKGPKHGHVLVDGPAFRRIVCVMVLQVLEQIRGFSTVPFVIHRPILLGCCWRGRCVLRFADEGGVIEVHIGTFHERALSGSNRGLTRRCMNHFVGVVIGALLPIAGERTRQHGFGRWAGRGRDSSGQRLRLRGLHVPQHVRRRDARVEVVNVAQQCVLRLRGQRLRLEHRHRQPGADRIGVTAESLDFVNLCQQLVSVFVRRARTVPLQQRPLGSDLQRNGLPLQNPKRMQQYGFELTT